MSNRTADYLTIATAFAVLTLVAAAFVYMETQ